MHGWGTGPRDCASTPKENQYCQGYNNIVKSDARFDIGNVGLPLINRKSRPHDQQSGPHSGRPGAHAAVRGACRRACAGGNREACAAVFALCHRFRHAGGAAALRAGRQQRTQCLEPGAGRHAGQKIGRARPESNSWRAVGRRQGRGPVHGRRRGAGRHRGWRAGLACRRRGGGARRAGGRRTGHGNRQRHHDRDGAGLSGRRPGQRVSPDVPEDQPGLRLRLARRAVAGLRPGRVRGADPAVQHPVRRGQGAAAGVDTVGRILAAGKKKPSGRIC
jgi:hypothetical protein